MLDNKQDGELKKTTFTENKHPWIKAAGEIIEEIGGLLERLSEICPILEKLFIRLTTILFLVLAVYAVVLVKAPSPHQNSPQNTLSMRGSEAAASTMPSSDGGANNHKPTSASLPTGETFAPG
jgi:hypothetical protein